VLRSSADSHHQGAPLVALEEFSSASFRRVTETLSRFARDPYVPVLLEGESGTGKTAVARYIHEHSRRRSHPFQAITLSAVDDSLCSSELFGHVSGAFTDARRTRDGLFASADRGTVFLDEIGKASLTVQQRLLNVIEHGAFRPVGTDEERHVDVRVIAASNVSLEKLSQDGLFLPDLYARLQVFRIVLPPLRERRADIPLLVERFVRHFAERSGLPNPPKVEQSLMDALCTARWPNNVRQLAATIQRMLVESDRADTLGLRHCVGDLEYLRTSHPETPLTMQAIRDAILAADGISGAARLLGVDRRTIQRRLKQGSATDQAQSQSA